MRENNTKKENLKRSREVLSKSDYSKGMEDEIYRAGVIHVFNVTFELAWKSIQEVFKADGVELAIGSPRQVLKEAYQLGYLREERVWLDMLKDRNTIAHIYDESYSNELYGRIFEKYIPAFGELLDDLEK